MCNYVCCLQNNLFWHNTGLPLNGRQWRSRLYSFAEWCSYCIYQQGLIVYASQPKLDLLVAANSVWYTNERDFLIIAISDWQLHWCGGKALKSHLEIQIREWECNMKAGELSSWCSDCCIVLDFSLFIMFYNCCSSFLFAYFCCCTWCDDMCFELYVAL